MENIKQEQIFVEMYKVNKNITKAIDEICLKYGINHLQLFILRMVERNKMNVSELSNELNISKSAISQALICLFLRKLAYKEPSCDNKKIFYVVPTNKGIEIVDDINECCLRKYNILLNDISEEEVDELLKLLYKFNRIINERKKEEIGYVKIKECD